VTKGDLDTPSSIRSLRPFHREHPHTPLRQSPPPRKSLNVTKLQPHSARPFSLNPMALGHRLARPGERDESHRACGVRLSRRLEAGRLVAAAPGQSSVRRWYSFPVYEEDR
jgi:hypothetical protein